MRNRKENQSTGLQHDQKQHAEAQHECHHMSGLDPAVDIIGLVQGRTHGLTVQPQGKLVNKIVQSGA